MTVQSSVPVVREEGRTLIAGAAGFIGQFVAEASLAAGRPTYVLLRSNPTCPSKAKIVKNLQDKGAIIIHGKVNEQEMMEKILKEYDIDIVISVVGGESLLDQLNLIEAIKAVGTIKRFLPSEFGHDVDRADPVEPGLSMYEEKRRVRRLIEEYGIPYTYICCNSIASWPYYDNAHPSEVPPPLDKFPIYGDGTIKAYFVAGADIGKFTIKAVGDIRTLNKSVHFRPPCNSLNMNELAFLWETKIGKTLPRETVPEETLLAAAAENIIPESIVASFTHDIFIKGCQIKFAMEDRKDVEVSQLYPDETFVTMDECFGDVAAKIEKKPAGCDGSITTQNPVVEPALPITASCA